MPIVVYLARVGQRIEQYALNDNATVKDLLEMSNEQLLEGETLQINGKTVNLDTQLKDGDRVFILPPASAGIN